jgi:ketosteroid isomerase-like protein
MPPGHAAVLGKKHLENFLRPLYEHVDADISMTAEEIEVAGDWAYEWGTLEGQLRFGDGPITKMDGKYLYVYQRQLDGSWKLARDIYNDNFPPVGPKQ